MANRKNNRSNSKWRWWSKNCKGKDFRRNLHKTYLQVVPSRRTERYLKTTKFFKGGGMLQFLSRVHIFFSFPPIRRGSSAVVVCWLQSTSMAPLFCLSAEELLRRLLQKYGAIQRIKVWYHFFAYHWACVKRDFQKVKPQAIWGWKDINLRVNPVSSMVTLAGVWHRRRSCNLYNGNRGVGVATANPERLCTSVHQWESRLNSSEFS